MTAQGRSLLASPLLQAREVGEDLFEILLHGLAVIPQVCPELQILSNRHVWE
jgi:hypothetical protein